MMPKTDLKVVRVSCYWLLWSVPVRIRKINTWIRLQPKTVQKLSDCKLLHWHKSLTRVQFCSLICVRTLSPFSNTCIHPLFLHLSIWYAPFHEDMFLLFLGNHELRLTLHGYGRVVGKSSSTIFLHVGPVCVVTFSGCHRCSRANAWATEGYICDVVQFVWCWWISVKKGTVLIL